MRNLKLPESKIRPSFKLSEDQVDLRTLDKNIVLDFLDEQMKMREQPIEAHLKKALRK